MAFRSSTIDAMVRAARTAGTGLMRDFAHPERLRFEEKNPSDFVTNADLRAQDVLRAELSAAFPSYAFLLEEGVSREPHDAPGRFIVDPLDGTTNFLRGLPHFAISIALEVDGEVVAGTVLDPAKEELFWAEKGRGAWLEERRLAVPGDGELSRTIIGTGIPHHGRVPGEHARYLDALSLVMREVAGIRRLGAAALDLAYVAAGRFDAFFELGLAPWDVAAGTLLVREAGGIVTRSDGGAMELGSADVLASRGGPLHARMVTLLAPLHRASNAAPL